MESWSVVMSLGTLATKAPYHKQLVVLQAYSDKAFIQRMLCFHYIQENILSSEVLVEYMALMGSSMYAYCCIVVHIL